MCSHKCTFLCTFFLFLNSAAEEKLRSCRAAKCRVEEQLRSTRRNHEAAIRDKDSELEQLRRDLDSWRLKCDRLKRDVERLTRLANERARQRAQVEQESTLINNEFIAEKANLLSQQSQLIANLERTNALLLKAKADQKAKDAAHAMQMDSVNAALEQVNADLLANEKEQLQLTKNRLNFLTNLAKIKQRNQQANHDDDDDAALLLGGGENGDSDVDEDDK